ncbi:single-strand DNA endonuclease ASTE1-like [Amphiura filiformis]|uniref:single-strand DNA endonuclease ASTE1-like n=1 Tax=Amphiura filiformis TaxID=82378 RepID=UPI003B226B90
MGVTGLASLVGRSNLLKPCNLRNIDNLVVDGAGLKHYIYAQCIDGIPGSQRSCVYRCGGEYHAFETKIHEFFQILRSYDVKVYVVFDGADDLDGKKQDEQRRRFSGRIDKANRIAKNQTGNDLHLIPPLAQMVLLQTLRELKVPFAFTNFEADNEIAGLANHFKCPVMANDSDFFIMHLEGGYIPFYTFDWKYGQAQIYRIDKFCTKFRVRQDQMSLFATLAGNDYVTSTSMTKFHQEGVRRTNQGQNRDNLSWLSNENRWHRSVDDSLQQVYKYVTSETTRSAIEVSLRMYEPSFHSTLDEYFANGISYASGLMTARIARQAPWCVDSIRNGRLPCYFINIGVTYCQQTLVQVENNELPSSNEASKELRQILYGVLLLTDEGQETENKIQITELDREGNDIGENLIAPLRLEGMPHVAFNNMLTSNTEKQEREKMLLSALGVNIDRKTLYDMDIPPCLHLPICIVIYWLSHAEPRVTSCVLDAFLLNWIWSFSKKYLQNGKAFDEDFHDLLQWTEDEVQSLDNYFDDKVGTLEPCDVGIDVTHSLAQFQSITLAAMDLNAAFLHPFPEPDIARLYNGMIIHCLYGALQSESAISQENWVNLVFAKAPRVKKLYQSIHKVISDNQWQSKTVAAYRVG